MDQLLDVYKNDENFKLAMWTVGRVIEVFKDANSGKLISVAVKFENDISVNKLTVPIDSDKIAPLGTKREPDEWRAKLKKGDIVDALDRCNSWYEATVVQAEERTECLMPMIKVGFRQYHAQGPKEDDMGKYFGFSSVADEHIGSYTVRIQPAYRYSKKGNSTTHNPAPQTEISYEQLLNRDQDEADLKMLAKPEDTIYATERHKCKSTVFVAMLNKFGNEKGFDKILATIQY